jgi:hypothetical protein
MFEFGGGYFAESKTGSYWKVFSYFLGENEFITGIRGKRCFPKRFMYDYNFLYETEFKIERD